MIDLLISGPEYDLHRVSEDDVKIIFVGKGSIADHDAAPMIANNDASAMIANNDASLIKNESLNVVSIL